MAVNDSAVTHFTDLKLKHKYRFVIFSLSTDFKEINVESTGEADKDYNEFITSLPKNECRYCVYDFEYDVQDGKRNKILFYVWAPDTSKVKQKMLYAASKDALRKKLDGIFTEIQCTDMAELAYETVLDKVLRMTGAN